MSKKLHAAFAAVCAGMLGFAVASPASAAIVNANNQIESEGKGNIIIEFLSQSAGDNSNLVSINLGGMTLFNNQSDAPGESFNMGAFADGVELLFRLDDLSTMTSFFTGLGGVNVDGMVHARLTQQMDGSILMEWEDRSVAQNSDFDYNDFVLRVYETPIPGAAFLLLTGLAGLGAAKRRKAAV